MRGPASASIPSTGSTWLADNLPGTLGPVNTQDQKEFVCFTASEARAGGDRDRALMVRNRLTAAARSRPSARPVKSDACGAGSTRRYLRRCSDVWIASPTR